MRLQLKTALIGTLMLSTFGLMAQEDGYEKRKIPKTDIELLYSYYKQDGIHSAVTGGEGTEDLSVHSPRVSVHVLWDSVQTFSFYGGTDVITSASTDKIDFDVSSASIKDYRVYGTFDYGRRIGKRGWWAGLNYSGSAESDYSSHAVGLWASWDKPDQSRRLYGSFRAYFDDLRWGEDYWWVKETLIYPEELRSTEWFDIYRRYTWHASLSYYQVINRRMNVALFPDLVVQNGLLSTTFHRVFFSDTTDHRVENLPRQRLKLPMGLRFNWFVGRRAILRAYYRFYWDNFDIRAHTFELETPVKLGAQLSLIPMGRYHLQTGARWFAPYGEHLSTQAYYTSDYDLSTFSAWQLGMGARWAMAQSLFGDWLQLKALEFRYAYYRRSDGLWAHWLSFVVGVGRG